MHDRRRLVEPGVVLSECSFRQAEIPGLLGRVDVGRVAEDVADNDLLALAGEEAEENCAFSKVDPDLQEVAGDVPFSLDLVDRHEEQRVQLGEPSSDGLFAVREVVLDRS